jgi:hypothetical protein
MAEASSSPIGEDTLELRYIADGWDVESGPLSELGERPRLDSSGAISTLFIDVTDATTPAIGDYEFRPLVEGDEAEGALVVLDLQAHGRGKGAARWIRVQCPTSSSIDSNGVVAARKSRNSLSLQPPVRRPSPFGLTRRSSRR